MSHITGEQLISRIAPQFPQLVRDQVKEALQMLLDEIARALSQGERVLALNFGSFSLRFVPPRRARRWGTTEEIVVPMRFLPHFHPGKGMRDRVNAGYGKVPIRGGSR
jgi:integration host factor subunit beta